VQDTAAQLTVPEAMHLWVARTENKLGKEASTIVQYRHLEKLVSGWAKKNGIKHAKDITSHQLESWYASEEWTRLAPTTRKQRWAVLRVMFAHMVKVKAISESPADPIEAANVTSDHVQGPYTDTQVKAILAHIDYIPQTVIDKTSYITRLRAFTVLLLDSGCDVSDALQYGQHQLEKMRIEKRDVWVFRYRRQKTKQQAVIPITAELAKMLRQLPLEPGVSLEAPFRIRGISLKAAQNRWSRRVQYAISAAKVTHIDLPDGRKKPANVKQLRHTAAVRWLRQGQRVEEVAKMLGHTNAEMVRRHYAPWVRDMDVAHVSRVVSQWK
jgi:integrase